MMTNEQKDFLEEMDLMLLSDNVSKEAYNDSNQTMLNSFSQRLVYSDIWSDALNAAESGSKQYINDLIAKVNVSDIFSDEKRWLKTILLLALGEKSKDELRRLASGEKIISNNQEADCLSQTGAIMAEKELKRLSKLLNQKYDDSLGEEIYKKINLERQKKMEEVALRDAEQNLQNHSSKY